MRSIVGLLVIPGGDPVPALWGMVYGEAEVPAAEFTAGQLLLMPMARSTPGRG